MKMSLNSFKAFHIINQKLTVIDQQNLLFMMTWSKFFFSPNVITENQKKSRKTVCSWFTRAIHFINFWQGFATIHQNSQFTCCCFIQSLNRKPWTGAGKLSIPFMALYFWKYEIFARCFSYHISTFKFILGKTTWSLIICYQKQTLALFPKLHYSLCVYWVSATGACSSAACQQRTPCNQILCRASEFLHRYVFCGAVFACPILTTVGVVSTNIPSSSTSSSAHLFSHCGPWALGWKAW
jgi:hypothetical protein